MLKLALALLFFSHFWGGFFSSPFSLADDWIEYEKGDKLELLPNELHPTQFMFSQLEVDFKIKELKKIMADQGEKGVVGYLKNHRGDVIVGPKNQMWLVDGHHHALALESLRRKDRRFKNISYYVKVVKEWNELSSQKFEQAMKLGNKKGESGTDPFVYLKDSKGRHRSFKSLPKELSAMTDSPWRSLVWLLKEQGAIEKMEDIPYWEFRVAEYLQKNMRIPAKMDKSAYQKAVKEALSLIQNAKDDSFPGFKRLEIDKCGNILRKIS